MNDIWRELFGSGDAQHVLQLSVRLAFAVLLGGILGLEREIERRPAGLRTHILVSLGAALLSLAPAESGMTSADASRVIQGIATGIGFIGAGAILKLEQERHIEGITTASSIWLTATVGVTTAIAPLWLPIVAAITGYIVLSVLRTLERR
jgi:putative Mg2+ transporter-C (MgtC) family protein